MNLKLAAVLIALSLPLSGCGNKGPLVMAERPPPDLPVVEPPPPTEPTDSAPPAEIAPPPAAEPASATPPLATVSPVSDDGDG